MPLLGEVAAPPGWCEDLVASSRCCSAYVRRSTLWVYVGRETVSKTGQSSAIQGKYLVKSSSAAQARRQADGWGPITGAKAPTSSLKSSFL